MQLKWLYLIKEFLFSIDKHVVFFWSSTGWNGLARLFARLTDHKTVLTSPTGLICSLGFGYFFPTNNGMLILFVCNIQKRLLDHICYRTVEINLTNWRCLCRGSAICGGTLMKRSLSSSPTGLLVSFRIFDSCSVILWVEFFSHWFRMSSFTSSTQWTPWKQ